MMEKFFFIVKSCYTMLKFSMETDLISLEHNGFMEILKLVFEISVISSELREIKKSGSATRQRIKSYLMAQN
jgi:hypothetical protein